MAVRLWVQADLARFDRLTAVMVEHRNDKYRYLSYGNGLNRWAPEEGIQHDLDQCAE